MNYQILKTLLDSLISNFKCPECSSWVSEKNIEIVGAAGTSVNLDLMCPNCEKHTFVKAEVSQINLWNIIDLKSENIEELKKKLSNQLSSMKSSNWLNEIKAQIQEKEILELRDILKNENINVEDFLGKN